MKNSVKKNQFSNFIIIFIIFFCVSSLLASIISVYLVIVIFFGMLPSLIAITVDKDPQRYLSQMVLIYNSLGISLPVIKIIRNSASNIFVIDIVMDPLMTWLIIYSSAALGWIIYWVFPEIAYVVNSTKNNFKIKILNQEAKLLTDEWGNEILNKSNK